MKQYSRLLLGLLWSLSRVVWFPPSSVGVIRKKTLIYKDRHSKIKNEKHIFWEYKKLFIFLSCLFTLLAQWIRALGFYPMCGSSSLSEGAKVKRKVDNLFWVMWLNKDTRETHFIYAVGSVDRAPHYE